MTSNTPQYLRLPPADARTYGDLEYDEKQDAYVIRAEPHVIEMGKRVFPGAAVRERGRLRFPATRRNVGDLAWFMQRYPLKVLTPERFRADHRKAIEHAQRREHNATLRPLAPPATFTGTLYPYQEEGAAFLLQNERAILADDMGLGKTVTALAAAATANEWPILVVVPAPVQLQWRSMTARFLDLPVAGAPVHGQTRLDLGAPKVRMAPDDLEARAQRLVHVIRGRKPYALPARPVYVIHYGLLADWQEALVELRAPTVIFDEIQELRHTGTAKYSAASVLSDAAKRVWGASGTPIYGYGSEIWSVVNIAQFHALGDFESFTREWCTGYGSRAVKDPDTLGRFLREEGLMIRRRKEDVGLQLPRKRRVVHVIDRNEGTYSSLVEEAVRLAHGYDSIKDWQRKGQALQEIERLERLATGRAKAPYAAEFVRGLLEAGERVLLCAYHHEVHDELAQRLQHYAPVRVTGRETSAEKFDAIERFRTGQTPLIQLALRSTAGLDGLQQAGTCIVFAELDWSPAIHSQCEDRILRLGVNKALESVLAYYLVTDTGSDETIQQALGLKIGQFVGLMGDQTPGPDEDAISRQIADKHIERIIERLRARRPKPATDAGPAQDATAAIAATAAPGGSA